MTLWLISKHHRHDVIKCECHVVFHGSLRDPETPGDFPDRQAVEFTGFKHRASLWRQSRNSLQEVLVLLAGVRPSLRSGDNLEFENLELLGTVGRNDAGAPKFILENVISNGKEKVSPIPDEGEVDFPDPRVCFPHQVIDVI